MSALGMSDEDFLNADHHVEPEQEQEEIQEEPEALEEPTEQEESEEGGGGGRIEIREIAFFY